MSTCIKRAGAVAALVFLELNGWSLHTSNEDPEKTVLDIASGRMDKSSLAEFLRRHGVGGGTAPVG